MRAGPCAIAWPLGAVHLVPSGYADRGLRASMACPACHAMRAPIPAWVTGAQRRRRGRASGPYSLIQGIKSGKPTTTRPAARFGHQKGGADGSTRNTP